MEKLKPFAILVVTIVLFFASISVARAQENQGITDVSQEINLDETITAEDLGVPSPTLLPDNPFYFLKNWGRSIRLFFRFRPIDKAKLRLRFASEKLLEAKKMVEKTKNPELIKRLTENYEREVERMREVIGKIKERAAENLEVGKFLDKFTKQQILHEKILEKLQEQVPPEVFEKIKETRERHLQRFGQVMRKLEENWEKVRERIEKNMGELRGSRFKDFKNLEILKKLEEEVPEEAKESIRKAKQNILKKLKERLEKMPTSTQERFREYAERIRGEAEKKLEIIQDLKTELRERIKIRKRLEKIKERILEKLPEEVQMRRKDCPMLMPPAPDFCKEGRIVAQKDERGCLVGFRCIIPAEVELPEETQQRCPPICLAIGTRSEGWYDSCTKKLIRWENCENCKPICKYIGTFSEGWYSSCTGKLIQFGQCKEKEIEGGVGFPPIEPPTRACITLWDPVCGKDGKTYSNECWAKVAGVEIAHKGVCREEKSEIPRRLPQRIREKLKE